MKVVLRGGPRDTLRLELPEWMSVFYVLVRPDITVMSEDWNSTRFAYHRTQGFDVFGNRIYVPWETLEAQIRQSPAFKETSTWTDEQWLEAIRNKARA